MALPIPPEAASAASSGGGQGSVGALLNTGLNALIGGINTRAQRRWNERMWHMQNEYNTPANQMERFEEAGLNPNLIYGQGNSGNAGAVAATQKTQTQIDPYGELGKYQSFKLGSAQTDNVEKQTEAIDSEIQQRKADTALKMMQTLKAEKERKLIQQQTAKTRVERNKIASEIKKLERDIRQADIDYRFSYHSFGSRLDAINLSNQGQRFQNEHQRISNDVLRTNRNAIIAKAYAEAKQAQLSLRGQSLENKMLEIKADLWSKGINPERTALWDIIGKELQNIRQSFREGLDNFDKQYNRYKEYNKN